MYMTILPSLSKSVNPLLLRSSSCNIVIPVSTATTQVSFLQRRKQILFMQEKLGLSWQKCTIDGIKQVTELIERKFKVLESREAMEQRQI